MLNYTLKSERFSVDNKKTEKKRDSYGQLLFPSITFARYWWVPLSL